MDKIIMDKIIMDKIILVILKNFILIKTMRIVQIVKQNLVRRVLLIPMMRMVRMARMDIGAQLVQMVK